MTKYAYLIIESTVDAVGVGSLIVDDRIKDLDHTWNVIDQKGNKPKFFRGIRFFEYPDDEGEREKILNLIYAAMKEYVRRESFRQR